MRRISFYRVLALFLGVMAAPLLQAQPTAFSYQGRLADGGKAASGAYDLRFALFDGASGGNQIGAVLTNLQVAVSEGLFTVSLDFGSSVFPGANRWLQIGVRSNGTGSAFATLSPRQPILATPYAVTASDVTGGNVARLNVANTSVQATGVPVVSFGFVVNATVTSGGAGYVTPPAVTVIDPSGVGAVISATVSNGMVTGLTVQNPGSGYSAGPTLTIGMPPSNAYQIFAGANFFTGSNSFLGNGNMFVGSFSGNGAGLTGVPGGAIAAGTLPGSALATGAVTAVKIAAGEVVKSLNGLSDGVTLTAGTNITLATTSNTITVSALSTTVAWQIVSGSNQQAQPNAAYIVTNAVRTTITLPSAPGVGSSVRIASAGVGGWQIAQNPGQAVLAGNSAPAATTIGDNWIPREASRAWSSLASSADGNKLVGVVSNGFIYTSTDSGQSWVRRYVSSSWASVASSVDGTKLVAVESGSMGDVHISTNSGVGWSPKGLTGNWAAVASSADGSKLTVGSSGVGGQLYVSTNSGSSWTAWAGHLGPWSALAASADGTKMVAAGSPDFIYTSNDSGVTWTARAASKPWSGVASSADGAKLVAVENGINGAIYTSTDSGVSWTPGLQPHSWAGVASSSDGTRLVAVANLNPDFIWTSPNSGASWTARESSRVWRCVASSADGAKLVAAALNGQIYTSAPVLVPGATTSAGTAGYLDGARGAAIELIYIGNAQFLPVSHEGAITAY